MRIRIVNATTPPTEGQTNFTVFLDYADSKERMVRFFSGLKGYVFEEI